MILVSVQTTRFSKKKEKKRKEKKICKEKKTDPNGISAIMI